MKTNKKSAAFLCFAFAAGFGANELTPSISNFFTPQEKIDEFGRVVLSDTKTCEEIGQKTGILSLEFRPVTLNFRPFKGTKDVKAKKIEIETGRGGFGGFFKRGCYKTTSAYTFVQMVASYTISKDMYRADVASGELDMRLSARQVEWTRQTVPTVEQPAPLQNFLRSFSLN